MFSGPLPASGLAVNLYGPSQLKVDGKDGLVLGRKRQAGRAAVMRGPLVYCLNPAQDAALAKLDAADLNRLVILLASLEGPLADEAVRPGGTACRLRASNEGYGMGDQGNLRLTLTEFPDPQGKNVYFRLTDLSAAVPDELVRPGRACVGPAGPSLQAMQTPLFLSLSQTPQLQPITVRTIGKLDPIHQLSSRTAGAGVDL